MEEFREWLKDIIKETKESAIEDAENECYDFFLCAPLSGVVMNGA